jgi:hypothetical protein
MMGGDACVVLSRPQSVFHAASSANTCHGTLASSSVNVTDIALASLEHMRYDTGVFVTLARQEGVT